MQPAEAHNNSEFLETYEVKKTVEELLQCPYWIIDILPSQVPEDSPGQYFNVSRWEYTLDRAGDCIDLRGELDKEGQMSIWELQMVYIIPADDGCFVAWGQHRKAPRAVERASAV